MAQEYHPGEFTPRSIAAALGHEFIDPGLVGQGIGAIAIYYTSDVRLPAFWLACGVFVLATIVLLVGCYRQVTYLGYRPIVAAIGLLSLAGVIVLMFLPDRIERGRGGRGFDVVMPRKASTLWVNQENDPDAPPARPAPQRKPWRL